MIEVGDKIMNAKKMSVTITKVIQGRHGMQLWGQFENYLPEDEEFTAFCVPELPPEYTEDDMPKEWVNDLGKTYITLANGRDIGCIAWKKFFLNSDWIKTIEECDAMWEQAVKDYTSSMSQFKTIEGMMSRPFTEHTRPDVI